MTRLQNIKDAVLKIEEEAGDDEAAHAAEDRLHCSVLEDVASGKYTREELRAFAKEALKTTKIRFSRWCA